MTTTTDFSLVCTEMGAHQACLSFSGTLCRTGALALESQFERLFGYYKYERIVLSIESPGGEIDGLEYVLRTMATWAGEGRVVAVRSTFQCASAAAFLLAMGQWGKRRVDRATFVLFHSARIDSSSMGGMTAAYSTNLSQALNSVDRKLLDVLVNRMLIQTGSGQRLADLIASRVGYLDHHWMEIAGRLSTLTGGGDPRKPVWLKSLQKWTREGADPHKLVLELKKHLQSRLQHEARMDLREAYALCLVDEIAGVLDSDSPQRESPKPVQVHAPGTVSTPTPTPMTMPVEVAVSVPLSAPLSVPLPVPEPARKTRRRPVAQSSPSADHMPCALYRCRLQSTYTTHKDFQ